MIFMPYVLLQLPFTGKREWEGNSSTAHYREAHPPEKSVFHSDMY